MSWVATAILGGAAIGAVGQAWGATAASKAQQDAAARATALQEQIYGSNKNVLEPYIQAGTADLGELQKRLPYLTSPVVMNQTALEKTPGYQWNLTQTLKAGQNSAAARGLGVSGAALKGASTFATGLADSTYQNQFNNENINRTNAYNRLMGVITTGADAGKALAGVGSTTGANIAGTTIAGGNAAAAGYNALGTSVARLGDAGTTYALVKGLYGRGNTAGGTNNGLPEGVS
jgi:hypothetical protein